MKINRIELYNIGSYEGHNIFDITKQNANGKITVIGGKNGAGKTTLFTAIKLCLYGYKESGYQAINSYYKKAIKKLINDKAKIENNAEAYVELDISIFNGQDWDRYILNRSWTLNGDNFEQFSVSKNDVELTSDEKDDFDNYLLNIIPPELFELYFFDGEQIADFFLEDNNGERIKKAFLTICGYDTFDILYRNFKRLSKENNADGDAITVFFAAEDALHAADKKLSHNKSAIEELSADIERIDMELSGLEKHYASGGGVSLEEWNQNFFDIKNEERIREEKNAWLKAAANDMVPYLILREEISAMVTRMNKEQDEAKRQVLVEALEALLPDILDEVSATTPGFSETAKKRVHAKLVDRIHRQDGCNETIMNLSKSEYQALLNQAMTVLSFSKEDIVGARKEIKASIKRSQKKRELIEASNVTNIDSFLKEKETLISLKADNINKREKLLVEEKELTAAVERAKAAYRLAEKELEKQFKNESINALTAKSIVFLDVLQRRLFKSEIEKVEKLFMHKMNQLMRKEQFIDRIVIDEDFTIRVYKKVILESEKVCKHIKESSSEQYVLEYGKTHCEDLLYVTGCATLNDFVDKYSGKNQPIETILEFDKSIMSKGEKQVFIMALYWAIMELCNKEVPFIIDTPFARIDTEHRAHITEYFFKELKGQVFIFSTDEEITDEHLSVIGNDLQSKFLIENIDNTKTHITANKYFGE